MIDRVTNGVVYTPPVLADLCRDLTMSFADQCDIPKLDVWDPCCGEGALLEPFPPRVSRYGLDLNPDTVQIAKERIPRVWCGDLFDRTEPLARYSMLVCNPPYVGRSNLRSVVGEDRYKWLKRTYKAERSGSCDLAGYVLRHVLQCWQPAISTWIVTNTIAQGSTRRVGLQWACTEGGYTIVAALKNIKWPGTANVTVNVITLVSGDWSTENVRKIYDPAYQFASEG